jgi:hypothetical protein
MKYEAPSVTLALMTLDVVLTGPYGAATFPSL